MTEQEFAEALRQELARRGGHFDPADVWAFVESQWHRIRKDPEVRRWAWEFLEQGKPDAGA